MSRKGSPGTRSVLPDPKHGSEVVARFINMVMKSGKKSIAENIVYGAMDVIGEKAGNPLELVEKALVVCCMGTSGLGSLPLEIEDARHVAREDVDFNVDAGAGAHFPEQGAAEGMGDEHDVDKGNHVDLVDITSHVES